MRSMIFGEAYGFVVVLLVRNSNSDSLFREDKRFRLDQLVRSMN